MDHQAEMRCHPPVGVPPPRVYWLRNGAPLEPDTNIIVSSEGHLLVSQARLQDTANYTCVAENIAARRISDPALLTVYGKFNLLFKASFTFSYFESSAEISALRSDESEKVVFTKKIQYIFVCLLEIYPKFILCCLHRTNFWEPRIKVDSAVVQ